MTIRTEQVGLREVIAHADLSDMDATVHDARYLTLDQTTPQTIANGFPVVSDFSSAGFLKNDAAGVVSGGNSLGLATSYPITYTYPNIALDYESTDFNLVGSELNITDGGIDHDQTANFAANEHFVQTVITNVSTALATGLLKVTTGTGALSVITDSSSDWDTAFGWGDWNGNIDISTDTNLVAGTNITLAADTLNVDDAFLVNDASDETSGTITAAGFTTAGTVFGEHLRSSDDLQVDGLATIGESLDVNGHIALGLYATPTANHIIYILDVMSLAGTDINGLYAVPILTTTGSSKAAIAMNFLLPLSGTGNLTSTTGHWGVKSGISNTCSGDTTMMGGFLSSMAATAAAGTQAEVCGFASEPDIDAVVTVFKGLDLRTNIGGTDPVTYWGVFQEDANADNYFAGALIVDDNSIQIQEGVDTMTFSVPTLTAARAVIFGDLALTFDQDVASGTTPTFTNTNFTEATDKNYVTDAEATVIGNTSGTNSGDEASASVTVQGIIEVATAAETDTGTDAARAVSPDGLQGSFRNLRFLAFRLYDWGLQVATGVNIIGDFVMPFAGTFIQDDSHKEYWSAASDAAGDTGTMIIDVNKNGITVMGTNKLDIEDGEESTITAATQPDVSVTTFVAGDILTFDIDAVHTDVAEGLTVYLCVRPT